MLTMRARPPPAKDFIDVFQKFKLSFNLLVRLASKTAHAKTLTYTLVTLLYVLLCSFQAKLKAFIHDPNAPELVHFLFTPLSLVVEASKDPRQGTPDLATKVVSPLLSNEARDLLRNCLTSKEAELWTSLGDAWTICRYVANYLLCDVTSFGLVVTCTRVCRDEWKGYVPPFTPRFSDGWKPSNMEDMEGGTISHGTSSQIQDLWNL